MLVPFSVKSIGSRVVEEGHTEYIFQLTNPSGISWSIQKGDDDFQDLHNQLLLAYGDALPALPAKSWLLSQWRTASRRQGLEDYLKKVLDIEPLVQTPASRESVLDLEPHVQTPALRQFLGGPEQFQPENQAVNATKKAAEEQVAAVNATEERIFAEEKAAAEKTAAQGRLQNKLRQLTRQRKLQLQRNEAGKAKEDNALADKKTADEKAAARKKATEKIVAEEKALSKMRLAEAKSAAPLMPAPDALQKRIVAEKKSAELKLLAVQKVAERRAAAKKVVEKYAAEIASAEKRLAEEKAAEEQAAKDNASGESKAAQGGTFATKNVADNIVAAGKIMSEKDAAFAAASLDAISAAADAASAAASPLISSENSAESIVQRYRFGKQVEPAANRFRDFPKVMPSFEVAQDILMAAELEVASAAEYVKAAADQMKEHLAAELTSTIAIREEGGQFPLRKALEANIHQARFSEMVALRKWKNAKSAVDVIQEEKAKAADKAASEQVAAERAEAEKLMDKALNTAAAIDNFNETIDKPKLVLVDGFAYLELSEDIAFVPVNRKQNPHPGIPRFSDPPRVATILKHVVDLLMENPTVQVEVQGHTATRPEMMNGWAYILAGNRAKLVRDTMICLGLDADRASAVGLPGSRGTNKQQVLFVCS